MMKTTTEKLETLDVATMTSREIRIAAKTAIVCGDLALAAALREEHDKRLTMAVNEKGYAYVLTRG